MRRWPREGKGGVGAALVVLRVRDHDHLGQRKPAIFPREGKAGAEAPVCAHRALRVNKAGWPRIGRAQADVNRRAWRPVDAGDADADASPALGGRNSDGSHDRIAGRGWLRRLHHGQVANAHVTFEVGGGDPASRTIGERHF